MYRNSSNEDNEPTSPVSFAELVYKLHGTGYRRDEIQPVYRPLVAENQSDVTSQSRGTAAQYTASIDALGLCVIVDPTAAETNGTLTILINCLASMFLVASMFLFHRLSVAVQGDNVLCVLGDTFRC